ncbi:hypothetical protein N2152v2_001638 [Parachlorella kessleri]
MSSKVQNPPAPNGRTARRSPAVARRALVVGGLLVGTALGVSALKGIVGSRGPSSKDQDLRQLEYVAGQLGVQGAPPPVEPIFKEKSGELFGLLARAPDGTQFLVAVDDKDPSRLKLKSNRDGRLYALETTATKLSLGDRAAMEKIFRTQGWEQRLKPLPRGG